MVWVVGVLLLTYYGTLSHAMAMAVDLDHFQPLVIVCLVWL